jgi:hypothetical protein
MAAKNSNRSENASSDEGVDITKRPVSKVEKYDLPDGYVQVNLDIVGFWNEDVDIHCVPLHIKLFDNKQDRGKPSILITARLVDPIDVRTTEGEIIPAKEGQLVGIWGRAGMRDLKAHSGCRVKIIPDGEIKLKGKEHPMRAYKIFKHPEDKPEMLKVTLDKRDRSKRAETPWVEDIV